MTKERSDNMSQHSLLTSNSLNACLAKERTHPKKPPRSSRLVTARQKKFSGAPLIVGSVIILQIIGAFVFLSRLSPPKNIAEPYPAVASFDAPPATFEDQAIPPEQIRDNVNFEGDRIGVQVPVAPMLDKRIVSIQPKSDLIEIRGLEITQGIQVFNEPENPRCHPNIDHQNHIFCNNSMPLVAGRHTMVRLYLGCGAECPTKEATVQLRIFQQDKETDNLTRQVSAETVSHLNGLPMGALRLDLTNSINFGFLPPPDWLRGKITFEVEIAVEDKVIASLEAAGNFMERKPLRVAYVPIQYQGVSPQEPTNMDYWLKRMYPVSDVTYYRLPIPDLVWDGELNKAEILQELLYVYWLYTEHQAGEAWPDQLFGWFPQEFYNGGASDPAWCKNCAGPHSGRVAFGGPRPEQDIGGPRILVHEVAHNLGARHAWSPTQREDAQCFRAEGADIRVDPGWPYAETPYIQEVGVDLYSDPPVIHAPSAYDMMAYCATPWISPHTYRKIFDSPLLQPDATPNTPAAFQPQEEGSVVLINGIIYPDGTISRPEIVQVDPHSASKRQLINTPPGHDYCLEVHQHDQTLLTRHCFDAGFLDVESGQPTASSPYFFTIPQADLADIASISLNKGQTNLITIEPSSTSPQAQVTFPTGGETLNGRQTLVWEAFDADGDSLTYDLLYSPDNGRSWLPLAVRLKKTSFTVDTAVLTASQKALLRVVVSDGFHTTVAETARPFSLR